jgi:UDP-GlcNAc:undecaprenyl-phosphate GlcNAc-1-phosphate transferase
MSSGVGIAALGFGVACAVSAVSLPLWRSLCRRWGHVDDPGHRKIHVQPVPLAGGFAVLTGWILGGLLIGIASVFVGTPKTGWLSVMGGGTDGLRRLAVCAAGAFGMAALGAWDDRRDLRPAVKFLVQTFIAVGVTAWGVQALFPESFGMWGHALMVLWILSVTNAFNLSDNMNGLCAGLGWIGAVGVAVSSLSGQGGHWELGCLAAVTAGSLAGYLPFNYPRASVFLGDAGSQWVGYTLAVLGLLDATTVRMSGGGWGKTVVAAAAVVAVPLIDMVFVTISRTWRGQPFWVGDTQHLSHRLARTGLGKPGAVAVLWALGIFLMVLLGLL